MIADTQRMMFHRLLRRLVEVIQMTATADRRRFIWLA
jgi:hypothetical protein